MRKQDNPHTALIQSVMRNKNLGSKARRRAMVNALEMLGDNGMDKMPTGTYHQFDLSKLAERSQCTIPTAQSAIDFLVEQGLIDRTIPRA